MKIFKSALTILWILPSAVLSFSAVVKKKTIWHPSTLEEQGVVTIVLSHSHKKSYRLSPTRTNNVIFRPSSVTPTCLGVSALTDYEEQPTTTNHSSLNSDIDLTHLRQELRLRQIKFSMLVYFALIFMTMPISFLPIWALYKSEWITKIEKERIALQTTEMVARALMTIIPFANVNVERIKLPSKDHHHGNLNSNLSGSTIWCPNHVSGIDKFIYLAFAEEIRGKNRRPFKMIYRKSVERNPLVKMFVQMVGFIPVDMIDTIDGQPNEYNPSSFKSMIKATKQAFKDGFDLMIFPEGQLNPNPEHGLLPIYQGARAIAKMNHCPVCFMASHGSHELWRANEKIGASVAGNNISMRVYPVVESFVDNQDFENKFKGIVGYFGTTGKDLKDDELERLYYCRQNN